MRSYTTAVCRMTEALSLDLAQNRWTVERTLGVDGCLRVEDDLGNIDIDDMSLPPVGWSMHPLPPTEPAETQCAGGPDRK
jgi:hypothetical protein